MHRTKISAKNCFVSLKDLHEFCHHDILFNTIFSLYGDQNVALSFLC